METKVAKILFELESKCNMEINAPASLDALYELKHMKGYRNTLGCMN